MKWGAIFIAVLCAFPVLSINESYNENVTLNVSLNITYPQNESNIITEKELLLKEIEFYKNNSNYTGIFYSYYKLLNYADVHESINYLNELSYAYEKLIDSNNTAQVYKDAVNRVVNTMRDYALKNNEPDIFHRIANIQRNKLNDYLGAIQTYKEIINLFPNTQQTADAYFEIGWIYQFIFGDYETAKKFYQGCVDTLKAMITSPDDWRYRKIADIQWAYMQDYENAIRNYRKIVDANPNTKQAANMLFRIGKLYESLNDFENEEKYYKEAIQTLRNYAVINNATEFYPFERIAEILEQEFYDSEGALKVLEEGLNYNLLSDEKVNALFKVAEMELRFGKINKSLARYQMIIEAYPNSSYSEEAQNKKIMIYKNTKDFSGLINEYRNMMNYADYERKIELQYMIGDVYKYDLKDEDKAIEAYEKVKEMLK